MRSRLTGRWRSWVGVGAGCFWVLALGTPALAAGDFFGRSRRPSDSGGAPAHSLNVPKPFIVRLADSCHIAQDQSVARAVGARYRGPLEVLRGFRAEMTTGQAARLKQDPRVRSVSTDRVVTAANAVTG